MWITNLESHAGTSCAGREGRARARETTGIMGDDTNAVLRMASSLVPIVKPDGKVHICGDYKLTATKAVTTEINPVDDLLGTLAEGVVFTKLDLLYGCQ